MTDAGFSRIMMERFSRALTYGGIAQLARAFGSYPKCHRFKSSYRYQRYKVSLKYPGSAAIVTDKLLAVLAKSCILIRPVGQAVKTRPFHGCNMGSIPVRVMQTKSTLLKAGCFFLLLTFWDARQVHDPYGNRKARPAGFGAQGPHLSIRENGARQMQAARGLQPHERPGLAGWQA